jgi:hypothetical protein
LITFWDDSVFFGRCESWGCLSGAMSLLYRYSTVSPPSGPQSLRYFLDGQSGTAGSIIEGNPPHQQRLNSDKLIWDNEIFCPPLPIMEVLALRSLESPAEPGWFSKIITMVTSQGVKHRAQVRWRIERLNFESSVPRSFGCRPKTRARVDSSSPHEELIEVGASMTSALNSHLEEAILVVIST